MRVRVVRWVLVLALVGSAACSDAGGQAVPSATVGTEPPRTTTTNPYAIPSSIDEAYVNRLLAAFDGVRGDVARLVFQTKTVPPEAVDRLRAIYGKGEFLQIAVDLLQDDIRNGFAHYRDPPGNPRTTVDRLITVTPRCVFAEVRRDYTEATNRPNPPLSQLWVVLVPNPGDIDPWRYNPTPWYSPYDGYQPGRVAPPDPCSQ